jgi:transcriptional regulator with XRE-family HTH domain
MLPYELTNVKKTRYLSIMGTRKIELGKTGRTVATRVRRIRKRNGLSLQDLSDLLAPLGRPILPSGLNKIEQGTRRVDVDDLTALADALATIPNDLLYEPEQAPAGISQDDYERLVEMVWHTKISAEGRVTEGRVTEGRVTEGRITDSAGLTDTATVDLQPPTDE